ncbi:MAG: efflux RND transporter periplasmic adaptor subunit, partial [Nitrospirota bacterium]|nr:efflux RND transporter periplasmic adaptor subunit [Nitrospirota bacterium]
MKQPLYRKTLVVGVVAIGVIAGVAVGFFTAHRMMTADLKQRDMKGMPMEGMTMNGMGLMGAAGTSAPVGRANEMDGMSGAPSGTVMIPTVMRQLIGVRSASAALATLEQAIRTVGTVGYDERGFTQVTVKTSGWVREVFVNSIGQPVRKGDPLFTLYSPDLLATQDEYLLAVNMQAQLAMSPLEDVKANAVALTASARERLRLWDVSDAQIVALERRGKAEAVLTVYAPSSGIVLTRDALPGKYVEPGTILYEV